MFNRKTNHVQFVGVAKCTLHLCCGYKKMPIYSSSQNKGSESNNSDMAVYFLGFNCGCRAIPLQFRLRPYRKMHVG